MEFVSYNPGYNLGVIVLVILHRTPWIKYCTPLSLITITNAYLLTYLLAYLLDSYLLERIRRSRFLHTNEIC